MTAETNPVLHPDRNLAMELVRATEAAAIRAYPFIGHG
ncbi:MAG: fructose-bisphosphatase class II, partial [Micrococcales bacterium]|nr:fructose-bisphosphatase class II [Micrococcales bacterium]